MYRVRLLAPVEPSTYRQCQTLDEAGEIAKEWLATIHRVPASGRLKNWELLLEKLGDDNTWSLVAQSGGATCEIEINIPSSSAISGLCENDGHSAATSRRSDGGARITGGNGRGANTVSLRPFLERLPAASSQRMERPHEG
jgi:hypothetical protein